MKFCVTNHKIEVRITVTMLLNESNVRESTIEPSEPLPEFIPSTQQTAIRLEKSISSSERKPLNCQDNINPSLAL
jgi:hypothetical protein